jgi:aryl-alcohol dehydrogenase-like predicted oxidoreductase
MFTRCIGDLEVPALGMGCWAIGGPFDNEYGQPVGWGHIDDTESIRAIHRALDLGITLFDTANVYGTGHSESVLGKAINGRRDRVVIATKFGRIFADGSRQITGSDARPKAIRRQCEESLRRLQTDVIDLYQFHLGNFDLELAMEVVRTLDALVDEGKIRMYGWSTDDPARAQFFAENGDNCEAVQYRLNIFERNNAMVNLCAEWDMAGLIRGPLGKGLLTGKFTSESELPANDVRSRWDLQSGMQADWLKQLTALRDVLTSDGRTLAQAAFGWLWATSEQAIPIPGFKTIQQVEENVGALEYGPLSDEQMTAVDAILGT